MSDFTPAVSVLLPVYNGAEYIRTAVASILAQTFTDFELLVVDDGSTDGTREILGSFEDPRIRLLPNGENRGLPYSLNRGLSEARAPLVARMDSDDESLPHRLAVQVDYLADHPLVGACGSWVETFGHGAGDVWAYPEAPEEVKAGLLFRPTLAHPSVMLRKSVLTAAGLNYDPDFLSSEDYDLWARAIEGVPLANVPQVLLRYRLPPPIANKDVIKEVYADKVRQRLLQSLGFEPTPNELALHGAVGRCEVGTDPDWLWLAERWLTRLEKANDGAAIYDKQALSSLLADRFWQLCWNARSSGPQAWRIFRESEWRMRAHVPLGMQIRFWWQSRTCRAGAVN